MLAVSSSRCPYQPLDNLSLACATRGTGSERFETYAAAIHRMTQSVMEKASPVEFVVAVLERLTP